LKRIVVPDDRANRCLTDFDAIRRQLLSPDADQLQRLNTVSREETVYSGRRGISIPAGVTDQDSPARAAEHEGSAEPGGAAANDDDIVNRIHKH
jgi:hypothetical protein